MKNRFWLLISILWSLYTGSALAQILNREFSEVENNLPLHWEIRTLPDSRAAIGTNVFGDNVIEFHVDDLPSTAKPWDIRLVQRNVQIDASRELRITTNVRSDGESPSIIRMAVFDQNMKSLGDTLEVRVTDQWQTVELVANPIDKVNSYLSQEIKPENVYVYLMFAYSENVGKTLFINNVLSYPLERPIAVINNSFANISANGMAMGWEATATEGSRIGVFPGFTPAENYLMTWVAPSVSSETKPWDIRVIQRGIGPVAKGMGHELYFDAWSSDGSATLRTAVFDASTRESLFDSQTLQLDTTRRTFIFPFEGTDASELLLYFMYAYRENQGVGIAIDNVSIRWNSGGKFVSNGDFSSWGADGAAPAWKATTPVAVGGVLEEPDQSSANPVYAMTLADEGNIDNPWAVRLVQSGVRLSPEDYRLSFRIRTDGGTGSFRAAVFDSALNALVDSQRITVNDQWQTITLPFTTSTSVSAMPYFMYGYEENRGQTLYLDDVSIVSRNLLRNSRFRERDQYDQPLYWRYSSTGPVTLDFSYQEEDISITVANADDSQDWHYELSQFNLQAEENSIYRLTFDIKGDSEEGALGMRFHSASTDPLKYLELGSFAIPAHWTTRSIQFSTRADWVWDRYSSFTISSINMRSGDTVSLRNLRLIKVE